MTKIQLKLILVGMALIFSLALTANAASSPRLQVLHSFTGGADGSAPVASLISDTVGNLYGTTQLSGNYLYGASQSGGSHNRGTVFKLGLDGTESILFNFTAETGGDATTPLVSDSAGNLYSSAQGSNDGIVFKLSASGQETILYTFPSNGTHGSIPDAGLTIDVAGNLYGTTFYGGAGTQNNCTLGCGTVFKLSPNSNGKWSETVLHNFDGSDGALPESVLLIHNGALYGTTIASAIENSECDYPNYPGCGVAFRVSP